MVNKCTCGDFPVRPCDYCLIGEDPIADGLCAEEVRDVESRCGTCGDDDTLGHCLCDVMDCEKYARAVEEEDAFMRDNKDN